MAGSLSWKQYTSDAGTAYSVYVDESNAEATVSGTPLLAPLSGTNPILPRRFHMRYANCYNSTTPAIKRKFWIGTTAALALLAVGNTISGSAYPGSGDTSGAASTWIVSSIRGERLTPPPTTATPDTGLTDGDG